MSKRKEKPVQSDQATEMTARVVAKRSKTITPPEAPETPSAPNSEYVAAIDKVKAALANYGNSVWQLAWALVDFKAVHEQLHPANRLTDKHLAEVLGINLSPARIGQLVNTAKAFPREQVDQSIDFRVYEQARTTHKMMTPEKRLVLVKENPTTAAINKLKPKIHRQGAAVHPELKIQITSAGNNNGEFEIKACLNNESHTLPTDLVTAIRGYAAELFSRNDGTVELTES